jgi:hypothetical protein
MAASPEAVEAEGAAEATAARAPATMMTAAGATTTRQPPSRSTTSPGTPTCRETSKAGGRPF